MRKSNAIIKVNIESPLWQFVEMPESLALMTGFSIDELTHRFENCFLKLLPYDESVFIKEQIFEQLTIEEYAEMDFILPCADSFDMWVHIQAEQLKSDASILEIWLSNTTQFHENTNELIDRLFEFENTLQGGIWCANCDSELSILWSNKKYDKLLGIERDADSENNPLKRKAILSIYPDDIPTVIETIKAAIGEGKHEFLLEYRVKRADSMIISVFTSAKVSFSHETSMPIIYCISYDISDLSHVKDTQRLVNLYKSIILKNATCVLEYDITSKSITGTASLSKLFESFENLPESAIESGTVSDECVEGFLELFNINSDTATSTPVCIQITNKSGDEFWLDVTRSIIYDTNKLPLKIIAHLEDVSIKHNSELSFLEARYHVPSPSYGGMFSCCINLTKNILAEVGTEFYNQFGFVPSQSFSDILAHLSGGITHPDDIPALHRAFDRKEILQNIEKGIFSTETELREKHDDGNYQWIRLSLSYANDPETNDLLVYVLVKDINNKKAKEQELRLQAERDSLTQLYNRITFESKVDNLLLCEGKYSHALFMIDLDNFKYVNDTYGHAYGDKVLVRVAEKLNEILSPPHIVGRIGGDEFTALAIDVTHSEASQLADEICSALQSALIDSYVVSASIGIAFAPNDGEQFNSLYHCADMALYEAKRKGKNCYSIYSKSMHNNTNEEKVSISREWLLDVSNDLVYVVDYYTYDLLYMNTGARTLFNVDDDYRNKKCYEVLQCRERPCEFCTNKFLSRDKFYRWEHYNEVLDRYLWLKDRIVDWYGVAARIEFATDVTEQELATRALERKIRIDNILVKSLREMSNTHSIDVVSHRLLEHVGAFYRADRICVYEYNNEADCVEKSREWVNIDVKPMLSDFSSIPIKVFAPMQKCFFNEKNYLLRDISEISESNPELHSLLKSHGTYSLYAVPFLLSNVNVGIVTLENPRDFVNDLFTLEALAFFISEQKIKTQQASRIQFLQEHDALTNLHNRAKFLEYKSDLAGREISSLGIVRIIINNLKNANTALGYDYADKLVCVVADYINKEFPAQGKYRLDSDEFVVTWENSTYLDFTKAIRRFSDDITLSGIVSATIKKAWTDVYIAVDDLYNMATVLSIED